MEVVAVAKKIAKTRKVNKNYQKGFQVVHDERNMQKYV
jgi:hypothetical protein